MTGQAVEQKWVTAGQYERRGKYHEVFKGRVIKCPFLTPAGVVCKDNSFKILSRLADQFQTGHVLGSNLPYYLAMTGNKIECAFMPHASFIRRENFPADVDVRWNCVPGLAVEVVAPKLKALYLQAKIQLYLKYGVEQVWVIYPVLQELHQYRRDGTQTAHLYLAGDKLDVSVFFPGVEIAIADIFKLPSRK